MSSFVKFLQLNYFILTATISTICLCSHIQHGYAMEEAPSVFSESYLESSTQLTASSNARNFNFIAHQWIHEFVKDLFTRFSMISLVGRDFYEENMTKLNISEEPVSNIMGFSTWTKEEVAFKSFSDVDKPHTLRKIYPLEHFLPNLDKILANVSRQSNFFKQTTHESFKKMYAKSLKASFLNVKRTLLRLRNDIEIASLWINQTAPSTQFIEAEERIKLCIGRIFFVVNKEGFKTIAYVGSGTVINIGEKKFILTCRHFGELANDVDLDIYFVPHHALNPIDYLPSTRDEEENVSWDSYEDYKINRLFLRNGAGMTSTITLKDGIRLPINENSNVALTPRQIKDLKKLEDATDNNDICFMEIGNPNILGVSAQLEVAEGRDLDDLNIWAAGYPGGGLSGNSIAVVNSSKRMHTEIIDKIDERLLNPDWHYTIASFPLCHGMSGGPVFSVEGGIIKVLAIIQGVDAESCGSMCALFNHEDIDMFN